LEFIVANSSFVTKLPDGFPFPLTDSFCSNEHDETYLRVLYHVCSLTSDKKNVRRVRNGYTVSAFDHTMNFDLRQGFPLLTTKEVKFNLVIGELLWFLEGGQLTGWRMSKERLNEIDGKKPGSWNIWTDDQAGAARVGKATFEGDCGVIYGSQWRNWNGSGVDQIANLIRLIKTDPYSRYMKVTAWNPEKIGDMCLPPCHENFQCFVRNEGDVHYLDMAMQQRSCDMFLGVPFNIASYALLTHMLAKVCGLEPGKLSMRLLDYHVYLPIEEVGYEGHMRQCIEQMQRSPYAPTAKLVLPDVENIDDFLPAYMGNRGCIYVDGYMHHPHIAAKMSPGFPKAGQ
jgi:thymidylate synthase